MKYLDKIYFYTFILLVFPVAMQASPTMGAIHGKVIDGENGDVLRSATIQLVDTKMGAITDIKGEFKIKNLVPSKYNLKISYIGYKPLEINGIAVNPNEVTVVPPMVMEPEINNTPELQVQAQRIMESQAAVLAVRKNATQVSDGISSEEIKRTPDGDAGQSLKRVTGITLVNDKFVIVRGLSERYSNTLLNGSSVATTEPDKKAFAYDMFPSEFIEYASVTKSYTPDLAGNFAGGLVQLNTIDFPQGFGLKFSASQSFNDNISMKDNSFVTYNIGSKNFFGFDNGNRTLPGNLPASPKEMNKLLYNDIKAGDEQTRYTAQQQWTGFGNEFNNKIWNKDTITAPFNGSYKLSFSNVFDIAGNDLGVIASAMYSGSYSKNYLTRGVLLSNGDYRFYGDGSQSTYTTGYGGLLNIAYKLGDGNSLSWKNTYNHSSDDEVISILGSKEELSLKQYSYDYVEKTLFASQLNGEHLLSFLQNATLNWNLGFSSSERDEPDYIRLRYSRNDPNQPYRIDIGSTPQGNGTFAGRFFSNLIEDAYSGGINIALPFEDIKIKIGGLYENKHRDFAVRSFTLVTSESVAKNYYDPEFQLDLENWTDDNILELLNNETDASVLFNPANFHIHGFAMSEDSQERDSYKAEEDVLAAYAMADYSTVFMGNRLRFIGGFRLESSRQVLGSYYPVAYDGGDSTFVNQNYLDFLPAINIVYQLDNESNLRLSASQSLTRPSLREYAPFTFYDFKTQLSVKGNPNLKRALIQNYDLRWETFPNPGEVISVGIFYKIFENAIEETILPASSEIFRSYANADGMAYNYGIEIEARKNLEFITDFLRHFSISSNISIINSEITVKQTNSTDSRSMCGQSPYSFNIGLFFAQPDWGTALNLSFNTYGKRIVQVGDMTRYQFSDPHVYELPKNTLDFSFSQTIAESFEITLIAKDLLNEKLIWEQGGHKVATNYTGRDVSIGLSYKIK